MEIKTMTTEEIKQITEEAGLYFKRGKTGTEIVYHPTRPYWIILTDQTTAYARTRSYSLRIDSEHAYNTTDGRVFNRMFKKLHTVTSGRDQREPAQ
jgi:hypothetical protein